MQNLEDAHRMLDVFASVGATHFDVTFLDIDGAKRGFRASQSARQMKNSLPKLLPGLTERQNSLVVRPVSDTTALIQLDDLNAEALQRVKDVAFIALATSPGNHQAWIAKRGLADKEFARRLRKGVGADLSASGATRLAGTVNYKRKYAPYFPTVTTISATPGHVVAREHVESLGLIAAPEPVKAPPLRVSTSRSWPDYERCVAGAPINNGKTGPDISRADFMWCLMAAQRGHGVDAIATKLMDVSSKAAENGTNYACVTAENAVATYERGRQNGRG